jgi:hypothetical protein
MVAEGGMSMGVYIKGMELPDNCYTCPFMFHQRRAPEVWCTAIENHWLDLRKVLSCDRHDDCPLVHVPPHGRLIDQDAILREVIHGDYPNQWIDKNELLRLFRNAPTVIEAEEGEV